jgi:tetratricopeptide (TPR) repeat protein
MEAMVLAYQRHRAEAAMIYRRHLEQERIRFERSRLPDEVHRDYWRNIQKQALLFFIRNQFYSEAEPFLKELMALDGPNWWALDGAAWDNLSMAGEVHEGLERWDEALHSYGQAMEIFEQRRHQLSSDELKTALASDSQAQYMYFQAARTALKAREAALAGGNAAGGREYLAPGLSRNRARQGAQPSRSDGRRCDAR